MEEVKEAAMLTKAAVENRVKRSPYPSRFGDLREYWASVMTEHPKEPEINSCKAASPQASSCGTTSTQPGSAI